MASPWDFYTNPRAGGPPLKLGPAAGGLQLAGLAGMSKPAPAAVPQAEPPWVTKAREARRRAKAGGQPPMSTTESQPAPAPAPPAGGRGEAMPPPGTGEIIDPWGGGAINNIPPPTQGMPNAPQGAPPGPPPLMGGIPRGGIMGGQGVPRVNLGGPQAPPLQRIPRNPSPTPPPPKAPRPDAGAVFGKVPGGGF